MEIDKTFDYIIIGGGSIGTSTVHALIRQLPDARIAWFTGDHKRTASNDFIKIIRDVYPDDAFPTFAKRALDQWTNETPYCDYFRKTGWIQAIRDDAKNMTKTLSDDILTGADMVRIVGSVTEPRLEQGEALFLNPTVGYADSALAVQAVSDMVTELGVKRHEKNVTKVVVENGSCVGVEVEGSIIKADKHIVVSTGAWTPALLEGSGITVPPNFFLPTAIGVATLVLSDEELQSLSSMPILATQDGEIMLSHREKVLKIHSTKTFAISHPDQLSDAVDITPNRQLLEKMLPQFKGRHLDSFICPDLLTPYQNQIIDSVAGVQKLIIATGGSYHSYKFLPNIGGLVVARIRGQPGRDPIEAKLLERCRWDRSEGTMSVHPKTVPHSSSAMNPNGVMMRHEYRSL
ncbi:FAD dependent oxidoreductase [Xylariaceae sp. FL0255]|nr:FAD dependent oxidoreductase [Xylariaceae sp. FL0255]